MFVISLESKGVRACISMLHPPIVSLDTLILGLLKIVTLFIIHLPSPTAPSHHKSSSTKLASFFTLTIVRQSLNHILEYTSIIEHAFSIRHFHSDHSAPPHARHYSPWQLSQRYRHLGYQRNRPLSTTWSNVRRNVRRIRLQRTKLQPLQRRQRMRHHSS